MFIYTPASAKDFRRIFHYSLHTMCVMYLLTRRTQTLRCRTWVSTTTSYLTFTHNSQFEICMSCCASTLNTNFLHKPRVFYSNYYKLAECKIKIQREFRKVLKRGRELRLKWKFSDPIKCNILRWVYSKFESLHLALGGCMFARHTHEFIRVCERCRGCSENSQFILFFYFRTSCDKIRREIQIRFSVFC